MARGRTNHLRLELCKLESAAVKLDQILRLGRFHGLVGLGCRLDRGRRLSLSRVSAREPGPRTLAILAVLAFPDKVGIASAATQLIGLLEGRQLPSRRAACMQTYKAVHANPVGMCLAARRALDLECIPEGILRGVIRPQIGHPARQLCADWKGGFATYPFSSAVSARPNILTRGKTRRKVLRGRIGCGLASDL